MKSRRPGRISSPSRRSQATQPTVLRPSLASNADFKPDMSGEIDTQAPAAGFGTDSSTGLSPSILAAFAAHSSGQPIGSDGARPASTKGRSEAPQGRRGDRKDDRKDERKDRREDRQSNMAEGRTARQLVREGRREDRSAFRGSFDDRRADRRSGREDDREERRTERAERQEDRSEVRDGRSDERETRREDRRDFWSQDRDERQDQRGEERETRREDRAEGREQRREDREERREERQLDRQGDLFEHYSAADETYAEHLNNAVDAGLATFREEFEDFCVDKILTVGMKRQAKRDVASLASSALADQRARQLAELDSVDTDSDSAEAEYVAMQLAALQNGWREGKVERTFEDELLNMALRTAALDACATVVAEQSASQELRDRVEDGAATAYRRSLKYTDGGGETATQSAGMAIMASQLANPALAPWAALGMAGCAIVDGLLGDNQGAAIRAAEREAGTHLRRSAKKVVRKDPRFDDDGAFGIAAAAAIQDLIHSEALQEQAYDATMDQITGKSLLDGFTDLGASWGALLGDAGEGSELTGADATADSGLQSGIAAKAEVKIPIPPLGKDVYAIFSLGGNLTSVSGDKVTLDLFISGGLGAGIDTGAIQASFNVSAKVGLQASGANVKEVMNNISYAFMRMFDSALRKELEARKDELAEDEVALAMDDPSEPEAQPGRIAKRIVGALWGMDGASGESAYDEAQIWAAMVEEQMVESGSGVGFSLAIEANGSVSLHLGGRDQPDGSDAGTYATSHNVNSGSALNDLVSSGKIDVSGIAGVGYIGEVKANDAGQVQYSDKMQEYVKLKAQAGPVTAALNCTFEQGLGLDADETREGKLDFSVGFDLGTSDPRSVASVLNEGASSILGPLEVLFGEWEGRHDGDIDIGHDQDVHSTSTAADDALRQVYVDQGVDNNVEGIAGFLASFGSLHLEIKGTKTLFGAADGTVYGRGVDTHLTIKSELDVTSKEAVKGTQQAGSVQFKAWEELMKVQLTEQQVTAPSDDAHPSTSSTT